jgi:hypothetical protein
MPATRACRTRGRPFRPLGVVSTSGGTNPEGVCFPTRLERGVAKMWATREAPIRTLVAIPQHS